MMLNREACKALKALRYPQNNFPQHCYIGDEDGGPPWEWFKIDLDLGALGTEWVACPSELEALEWLEDEHSDHWRYARDEDGLWYVQNGEKPTRKTYREIGRFRAPSELILAIYENWMSSS